MMRRMSVNLDLARPLESLRAATGVDGAALSQLDLGKLRGVSQPTVSLSEKAAGDIRVSTLAAYAIATGYRLRLVLERA